MEVHGVIPPMCTPTTREGEVDIDALRRYVRFLESKGVHGLFPCGTTGEFTSLSREQRRRVIEVVADETESIPILAGCGDTRVSNVLDQITVAESCGADIAVVIVPYYLPSTAEGIYDFFAEVAAESALPLFLYNLPELAGYNLSIDELEKLAEYEQIIGLKDTTGNLLRFQRLSDRFPSSSFSLFQGDGTLALPSLGIGCSGLVAGSANICPSLVTEMFNSYRKGDIKRAHELMYDDILPVIRLINTYPSIPSIKYLVGHVGPDIGSSLPPLPSLDAEQKVNLRASFDAF